MTISLTTMILRLLIISDVLAVFMVVNLVRHERWAVTVPPSRVSRQIHDALRLFAFLLIYMSGLDQRVSEQAKQNARDVLEEHNEPFSTR